MYLNPITIKHIRHHDIQQDETGNYSPNLLNITVDITIIVCYISIVISATYRLLILIS